MSAASHLFIPKRFAAARDRAKRIVGTFNKDTFTEMKPHPGRPQTQLPSSWVADLVALQKAIVLCWACQPKFDHKRNHYYKDMRFQFHQGQCDGCRSFAAQGKMYVHESCLAEPDGRLMSGQVITPV